LVLKYIYFPTGRQVWADLAKSLYESGSAEPVIWVGDPSLDNQAASLVKDGLVIDFIGIHSSMAQFELNPDIQDFQVFQKITTSTVREKAIKMMDRHDPYGAYRNIDRDIFFKSFVLFSIDLINRYRPDFLLMAESPHSPFQFVLYKVAKVLGVEVFSFVSWSIAPLACIREDIDGQLLNLESPIDPNLKQKISERCEQFFDRFSGLNSDIEPEYMKRQRSQDEKSFTFFFKMKKAYYLLREMASRLIINSIKMERGLLNGTRFDFMEPAIKQIMVNRNQRDLRVNMEVSIDLKSIPKSAYAYFPLHYEPERTTNPDGLDFHDQITSILALRSWLPRETEIIVKEHYSQFTSALQGFKGRSKEFYFLLRNIKGVSLADPNINSKNLIEGAVLTATITGTAALESALLGVPAVIFGNPWFRGIPGVWDFSSTSEFADFKAECSKQSWEIEDIKGWVFEKISKNCFFLSINPSNERYFVDFYEGSEGRLLESELLFTNVRSLIISKVKRGK
tara:strand:+ start:6568 stop:8094 length:1527 start_codon:yes stop_codon:yes gene_type:complete